LLAIGRWARRVETINLTAIVSALFRDVLHNAAPGFSALEFQKGAGESACATTALQVLFLQSGGSAALMRLLFVLSMKVVF
jgi:hypothetical protein